jgi:hypothetical protein
MRLTHPPSSCLCFAASRTVRTNLTAPITIPEKETVPKEGPKALLKKEKNNYERQQQLNKYINIIQRVRTYFANQSSAIVLPWTSI